MKCKNNGMKKLVALLCALAMLLTMAPAVAEEPAGPSGRHIRTEDWVIYGDENSIVRIDDAESGSEEEDTVSAAAATTVAQKVEELAQACIAAGAEGDYEIALWMHDWLIYNADYDHTLTEYGPEGVLLKGTGVCQSYTLAYELLLNRMGVENEVLTSPAMDHAWNLVCIDGVWCHVDCTWDDPNEGGYECHDYFGMNDALMARDHVWDRSAYRACTSTEKYYPVYTGETCVDSLESLEEALAKKASAKEENFTIYYIGESEDFDIMTAVDNWVNANHSAYDVTGFGCSGSDYCVAVELSYSSSGGSGDSGDAEDTSGRLETPVPAPDFALNSLNGCYRLSDYAGNGVVLVFGRDTCSNTLALVQEIPEYRDILRERGVEVLVCIADAVIPANLSAVSAEYPGVNFVCDSATLLAEYLKAVGNTASMITYPAVFVINGEGMITYYSTDYVSDVPALMDEALAVGTGKELPQPGENDYDPGIAGSGSIAGLTGAGAETLRTLAADSGKLIFLTDYTLYDDLAELLDYWQDNLDLFAHMNFRIAASFADAGTAETVAELSASYPDVTFFAYDDNLFWDMLEAAGFEDASAYYRCGYVIESNGDIASYTNGSVIHPWNVAVNTAIKAQCDVVAPDDLAVIDEAAFENADVKSVDLTGSDVNAICDRAFADCAGLELIKIPDCVNIISDTAFEGCGNLLILCDAGSAAQAYAEANGILCLAK